MTAGNALRNGAAGVIGLVPPAAVRRLPAGSGASLGLLLNRAVKKRPRSFTAAQTDFGFTVEGCTSDIIQRYLYVFGVWEPDLSHWLRDHLRPGDVAVDIGANIGYFSLLAARIVGAEGAVIAFEPVPSIADMLEHNAARNGLAIEVRREVVSDRAGRAELFKSADSNIGRSGTAPREGSSSEGTAPMVTGAAAIPVELWPRIRFIKVDVEGDEQRVIDGLLPVLRALPDGAAVFIEVTPDDLESRGGSAAGLLASMSELGFSPYVVRNSYAARDYARYRRRRPVPLTEAPTEQADVIFIKEST
jgi:FkbM family methyltransferase